MANVDQVRLPDGSQYNLQDTTSNYATQAYVQQQVGTVNKNTIGLGNVDNTHDADKPVSTAQQTALDAKVNNSVVASVQNTTTAVTRYEIGEQFLMNGYLYEATAIIPNNSEIIVGTNCELANKIIEQIIEIAEDLEQVEKRVYRKYIFVSDSYGASVVPNVVSMLGLSASDYVSIQQGGSGFGGTYGTSTNWQTMIENTVTTNNDTYTDVVYIGGCNEAACEEATITINATNCYDYVQNRFPNSKQWYMFAGYFGGISGDNFDITWRARLNKRMPICLLNTKRAFILNEVWYPLADTNNMNSSDWEHPNATGAEYIASCIVSCLNGGKAEYKSDMYHTETLTSATNNIRTFLMYTYRHNDRAYGRIRSLLVTLPSAVSIPSTGATITLGTLTSEIIRGGSRDDESISDLYLGTTVITTADSGNVRNIIGSIYLSPANELKISVAPTWREALSVTTVQITYFEFELSGYMN